MQMNKYLLLGVDSAEFVGKKVLAFREKGRDIEDESMIAYWRGIKRFGSFLPSLGFLYGY